MSETVTRVPEVSIVIASFNKGPYLEATLQSAVRQGQRAEVVIVDDASTDQSREVIGAYSRTQASVRSVLLDSNQGGAHCRNVGLRLARGRFVLFLDADDLLADGCVDGRLAVAQAHPDHDAWIFPMSTFIDDPRHPNGQWTPRRGDHLANFLAHRLDWSIMQPLWRREFLDQLGGFDVSFARLQDPEMHVRALMSGARVLCMPGDAADCHYRIDVQRHGHDAVQLAERHVAGAIHFYRTFYPKVPARYRACLAMTLLASLAKVDHWRRAGRIFPAKAAELEDEMIRTCELARHRVVLRLNVHLNRAAPAHVPGLRWLTQRLIW